MSQKRNRNKSQKKTRKQSRGVIGNLVGYVPGIGQYLKPIVGGVEDFVVSANRGSVKSRGNVAAARSMASRSFFKSYAEGTDMHCVGCDLVRPVPQNLTSRGVLEDLFSVIPANPAYWGGTRIAQIAPGYQQYRPLKFRWIYVPQVAVTQQGTVTIGTLWNSAVNTQDLQQTLVTSNGGLITQCYNQATSNVRLGDNLPYNLFELAGPLSERTNPFLLLAGSQGTNGVTPGYFMIEYHYVFKNPIGSTWSYGTDWQAAPEMSYPYDNVSAVVLSANSDKVDPGQILVLDQSSSSPVWTGAKENLTAQDMASLSCALFACTPNEFDHGVVPTSVVKSINTELQVQRLVTSVNYSAVGVTSTPMQLEGPAAWPNYPSPVQESYSVLAGQAVVVVAVFPTGEVYAKLFANVGQNPITITRTIQGAFVYNYEYTDVSGSTTPRVATIYGNMSTKTVSGISRNTYTSSAAVGLGDFSAYGKLDPADSPTVASIVDQLNAPEFSQ